MEHEKLIEKHLGINTPQWIKEKVDNAIKEALHNPDDRLKRSDKLWKKLVKELDVLHDDNYTARRLFDYVERHYA